MRAPTYRRKKAIRFGHDILHRAYMACPNGSGMLSLLHAIRHLLSPEVERAH